VLDDGAHCRHLVITADYVAAITVTTCCYAFAAHPMGRWWHYVFYLSIRLCVCVHAYVPRQRPACRRLLAFVMNMLCSKFKACFMYVYVKCLQGWC